MNHPPKVTVIVCAHNEEKLLPRCMESLLRQTLEDISIILVDDASTDRTLELMNRYRTENPDKIHIIHTGANLRLGGARNLALPAAQGEYIAFCDCDDHVDPDMYRAMYNEAKSAGSDVCYCRVKQITETGRATIVRDPHPLPAGTLTESIRKQIIARHTTFIQKFIYKRRLFIDNNIQFPAGIRYEDIPVSATILPYINTISNIPQPFYNYCIRPGSITTAADNTKYRDKQAACLTIVDEYKKRGLYPQYRNEVNYLYFRKGYIHASLNYIINSPRPEKQVISGLKNTLLSIDPRYRKNPYYPTGIPFIIIDIMLSCRATIQLLKLLLNTAKYNI